MKKFSLLFAFLLTLLGGTKAQTVTEGFEYATDGTTVISVNDDNMGLSNGWVVVGSGNYVGISTGTNKDLQLKSSSYVYEGTYSIGTQYSNTNTWLVCPVEVSGTLKFYARRYSSSRSLTIGLAIKDGDTYAISNSSFATYTTQLGTEFTEFTVELGDDPVYVAFKPSYAYFDNVTYTPYTKPNGPALVVKDYDSGQKLTSPASYDFGLAAAGTIHYFLLTNPGTEDLDVTLSKTGNFGATLSTKTVPAGGNSHVALTVTMPEATGSSKITITPASGSGINPFEINVSGTVKDPNKMFEDFSGNALPDGWVAENVSQYSSWNFSNGYASHSSTGSSSAGTLTSPKLTFTAGETIIFKTSKYSSSTWYNPGITIKTSNDGTTWSDALATFTDDVYGEWKTRSVVISSADVKYIRFTGWYVCIDDVYGGDLPKEPKMVVTQPTSLDYGVISAATTKTFTIANKGLATLEGINVTSSNSVFAITGAPTSLAAGESAEVTITMDATTTGALSSDITVSATGMENVQFTVTGVVLPAGLFVVDFNDNALPTGWTNASWTFADGAATGKSSSAYLTTPKLTFSDGDMLVIKAKRADSDATDYITVQGSNDDGATWTAYSKKITGSDGLAYPDYGTIVLTDIPSTVNKLRFVGYWVVVDEIAGLTYAPVLSVTQSGTAVSSPANYDFGECAADATVTYNFANAGAGTINITNVEITGTGAAAYSTNWTTTATAPFDLTISRSYDATRTGASEAAVTVTTTEGDFVINVTGTDKAANAPELAVSPAEDADFGVVTAATEKTYTVTNAGTGLLTVNIYSNDAKFTVAPAQLTDIAAGESQTFTVTFTPVAGTYGTFTAEIVVIPTYDGNAAVPFNASAKVKDPNVWSEDFSGNALPTGWSAESNWSFDTGVAKAAYQYGTTNYLTTPTLTVSDATEELTFDYSATANYVSVKIQMSKDGAAFVDYAGYPSSLNNGNSGTFTITGLEPGNYQFRFANDDYELDNFEGFKLNLADHICTISDSNIPASTASSPTMKVGKSFDATVTVKELRGVAEALTAKLFMGDEVIGTATGNVAANGTETLTIVCTPTTDGYKAMHIEVEYAGGVLTTTNTYRSVAALTYLTLDETSSDAIVAGTYDNVTLKRTFIAGWNTVCLPFDINDVEAFFGTGAKAYEFSSYSSETGLNFSTVSKLNASYPYIVYVATAIDSDINLTDVEITSTNKEPWYTRKTDSSNNALYFRGTYAPMAAGTLTGMYGVTDEAKIVKGNAEAHMNGFRAYFELTDEAATARILFDGEDVTTSIDNVNINDNLNKVYNLNGQKVQKAQKGLYIVNGKKVVVK